MNLLVLGNGFDINQGFDTSYKDFIELVIECTKKKQDDIIEHVAYPRISSVYYDRFRKFYKLINEKINDNFFLSYFVNYTVRNMLWCDFEEEIQRILLCFDNIFNEIILGNVKYTKKPNRYYFAHDQVADLLEIESTTNKKIFKIESYFDTGLNSSYYELSFIGILDEGLLGYNKYNSLLLKKFIDVLYKDLLDFTFIFHLYLSLITPEKYKRNPNPDCVNYYRIINYNYTNIAYNCYPFNDDTSFIYLNGSLQKPESIILGLDSNTNFKSELFQKFSKRVLRCAYMTDYKLSVRLDNMIYSCIDIFGHSLTLSDKESLSTIFASFDATPGSGSSINIYYYCESDDPIENNIVKADLTLKLQNILDDKFDNYYEFINFINYKEFKLL